MRFPLCEKEILIGSSCTEMRLRLRKGNIKRINGGRVAQKLRILEYELLNGLFGPSCPEMRFPMRKGNVNQINRTLLDLAELHAFGLDDAVGIR
jgi:hypothetical protein